MIFLLTKNKMTTTHTSFSKIMGSIDLRRKIFHFKSLSKKKQVHENYSLVMDEFKSHIKSYVDFFNDWPTVPNWIEDNDDEEEPYHNFVDIVNDISKPPYQKKLPSAYGWLFLVIKNLIRSPHVFTPENNPNSW